MKRAAAQERLATQSRERDILTPEEKIEAVKSLAPKIYPGMSEKAQILSSGSVGARDSAHDVFFVNAEGHPNGTVAVKRFRRSESAHRELEAIQRGSELGFSTFQPVNEGVYPIGDVGTALVTSRLKNFRTMNQVGWQNWYAGQPEYEDIANTLRSIASFTGHMHGAGIVGHDRQLKNYGQAPASGFILFDLENADFYEPGSEDSFDFQSGCVEDMRDLATSLVTHGYLGAATDRVFKEELASNVLDPYSEINFSETVIDSWDKIVDESLLLRQTTNSGSSSAAGVLAMQGSGLQQNS